MHKIITDILLRNRINSFFGTCNVKLILEDGNSILIGRGSIGIISKLSITLRSYETEKPLALIGNFCEFAECSILIGSEHENSKVFNSTLSGVPIIRDRLPDKGVSTLLAQNQQLTLIGNGTIISKHCIINVGSEIGNGCVIGSGAVTVASKKIDHFSIAVGVPAVSIKSRLTPQKREIAEQLEWWNWDLDFLCENATKLIDCEVNYKDLLSTRVMASDRYSLVIAMKGQGSSMSLSLLGIDNDGVFIPMKNTNASFREYFAQIKLPEATELTWLADPFKLLDN